MEEIKELYLELKRQIWENAYNVNDNHWTKMTLNLDLIMNEFHKQNEILDILKKWFMESITDYRDYDMTLFVDDFIRKDEPIFKILEEWLNNDK